MTMEKQKPKPIGADMQNRMLILCTVTTFSASMFAWVVLEVAFSGNYIPVLPSLAGVIAYVLAKYSLKALDSKWSKQ